MHNHCVLKRLTAEAFRFIIPEGAKLPFWLVYFISRAGLYMYGFKLMKETCGLTSGFQF